MAGDKPSAQRRAAPFAPCTTGTYLSNSSDFSEHKDAEEKMHLEGPGAALHNRRCPRAVGAVFPWHTVHHVAAQLPAPLEP